jgi:hypothetical protein
VGPDQTSAAVRASATRVLCDHHALGTLVGASGSSRVPAENAIRTPRWGKEGSLATTSAKIELELPELFLKRNIYSYFSLEQGADDLGLREPLDFGLVP